MHQLTDLLDVIYLNRTILMSPKFVLDDKAMFLTVLTDPTAQIIKSLFSWIFCFYFLAKKYRLQHLNLTI